MADTSEDSREQGVELGSLAGELEAETFPLTRAELLDRYGDHEIDLAGGSTKLEDVLEPRQEREYEDVDSVRQTVFNMVGEDAVGREGYSDRGGSTPEDDPDEEQSI